MSPHFLFGRIPRGPLSGLKETWTGVVNMRLMLVSRHTPKQQYPYLNDLEKVMRTAEKYAREHAVVAQKQYADYYNKPFKWVSK